MSEEPAIEDKEELHFNPMEEIKGHIGTIHHQQEIIGRLHAQLLDLTDKMINPPIILSMRAELIREKAEETMRKEFTHIIGRLYWK